MTHTPPKEVDGAPVVVSSAPVLVGGSHRWVTLVPTGNIDDPRLWEYCIHCKRLTQTMD